MSDLWDMRAARRLPWIPIEPPIQPCDGCKNLLKPAQRGASPFCTAGKRETIDWLNGTATVTQTPELLSVMRGKDGACGRSAKLREPA